MKEELIQKALNYVEDLETFVVGQLPPFISEVLNYALFENLLSLILFCFAYSFTIILWWKWWTPENRDFTDEYGSLNDEGKCLKCCTCVITLLFCLMSAGIAFGSLLDVGKIYLAPRLFIVEYLSELIK